MKGDVVSWFMLRDQPDLSKRDGIWLMVGALTEPVLDLIKESKLLRWTDVIHRVIILETHEDGRLFLRVWSRSIIDEIRRKRRYNVFNIIIDADDEWICEGDLGRGLHE